MSKICFQKLLKIIDEKIKNKKTKISKKLKF
jgi:hypothetical protein